jgi:hypothetical protein
VADSAPGGPSLDVLGAGLHLIEHRRKEGVECVESVHPRELAPSLADLDRGALQCRLDHGPAQLGDIFNAPSGSSLFPIDQSHGHAVSNNDVPGLEIVVDYALEAVIDQVDREVVELPHHLHEREHIDLLTGCRGNSRDPGDHLAALFIDPQRARSPCDVLVFDTTQHPLDERSVPPTSASDGIANAARAVHQVRVP